MRVEAARRLLAATRDPVKRVAQRCGFGSEETMRRCLLRQVGIPPGDYRARFSSPAGPTQRSRTARTPPR
jgi:transcriptional regulator GlxA family with amidase domain